MGEKHLDLGIVNEKFTAVGTEKKAYDHVDKNKIVKITHCDTEGKFEPGNERYMKAEFYLTKILHFIFPDNIPDIHLVSGKYKASIHERKELGQDHTIIRDFFMSKVGLMTDEEQDAADRLARKKKEAPLIRRLQGMGIKIDRAFQNFGENEKGNLVYVDSIIPWEVVGGGVTADKKVLIHFNPDQLKEIINDFLDESKKTQALNYLDRLSTLVKEEIERYKKRN